MDDEAVKETVAILNEVPGGRALLAWFGGPPDFGDAEVLELRLVRKGTSRLRLATRVGGAGPHKGPRFKHAVIDFTLRDMIDVHVDGFGHQNVIDWLALRRPRERALHPSLLGHGPAPGNVEMELGPCAGAFGTIRCTIEKIAISPVADYQKAE